MPKWLVRYFALPAVPAWWLTFSADNVEILCSVRVSLSGSCGARLPWDSRDLFTSHRRSIPPWLAHSVSDPGELLGKAERPLPRRDAALGLRGQSRTWSCVRMRGRTSREVVRSSPSSWRRPLPLCTSTALSSSPRLHRRQRRRSTAQQDLHQGGRGRTSRVPQRVRCRRGTSAAGSGFDRDNAGMSFGALHRPRSDWSTGEGRVLCATVHMYIEPFAWWVAH